MDLSLLFVSVLILIAVIAGVFLHMKKRLERKKLEREIEYTYLEVRVSKHTEHHFKDIEDMYQGLATLAPKQSWWSTALAPHISFEIYAQKGSIQFYIRAPKGPVVNSIINFLKGRYKQIEITEAEDPCASIGNEKAISLLHLKLTKPAALPLKKYTAFEQIAEKSFSDPLSSLISTVSTLQNEEEVAVQFVLTPIAQDYKKKIAKDYALSMKRKYAWAGPLEKTFMKLHVSMPIWLKVLLFPLWLIVWLIGIGFQKEQKPGGPSEEDKAREAAMREKMQKPLVAMQGTIAYIADKQAMRAGIILELSQSFATMGLPEVNNLKLVEDTRALGVKRHILKRRTVDLNSSLYLNTEEASLLWHPPTHKLYSPYIHYLENALEMYTEADAAQEATQPALSPLLYPTSTAIGTVENYGKIQTFTIDDVDRRRHVYIIGQTGTGKSTLQEQMILSSIYKGHGVAVIDPHGEMVERLLNYIPKSRKNDIAYFDPSDAENPPAFNILSVDKKGRELIANELMGIFHKMFENSWGPRMEQILYNTIMGLVETPNATLVDIPAFITTKTFREDCLKYSTDEHVVSFWHDQFDVLDPKLQKESVVAVLNKVEKFLNNRIVRNVFASKRNRFNFDFIMNKQKILLVNLSKGRISPINSEIIGSMIVSRLLIDAMKRIEIPEEERKDFFLYIDEFQNFVSSVSTFENILSEARKYRLNLTVAHQYMAQLPPELRSAIFGNVGTVMSFRTGLEDAGMLVKQFGENDVTEEQLTTLVPFTLFSRSVKNNKITGAVKVKILGPIADRYTKLAPEEMELMTALSKKQYSWNADDKKTYEKKQEKVRDAKERERAFHSKKKQKKSGDAKPAKEAEMKEEKKGDSKAE